jgi:hypothetical protein
LKVSVKEVFAVNPAQHFAELRLLLVLKRMEKVLHPARFHKLEECHNVLNRQAAAELAIERIVVLKMIVGLRHLQQALGADKILTFDKVIQASPAVTRVEQRDEILENSVGG